MSGNELSVREIQQQDIELIIDYWLNSDNEFMKNMGVDVSKIPAKKDWESMLWEQLSQSYEKKNSYCIIWEDEGKSIGHSNVNKIIYGQEAYMHLHLWKQDKRKKGLGTALVKKTLPYFFNNLDLKKLFCEPYALNPAPNKVLEKTGFEFVKEYTTIPGWLNFEQQVNLWVLDNSKFISQ